MADDLQNDNQESLTNLSQDLNAGEDSNIHRIYRIVKIYFKTLASSTYIGFHEGRRQFIYEIFTRKYVETKEKLFTRVRAEYRRCDPYISISITESKINILFENMD